MGTSILVVFAKTPVPGWVKTRLCPPLTPVEAAEVHRACLRYTCESLATVPAVRTVLAVSPDNAQGAMRGIIGHDCEVWPQGPGGLGQRLSRCIARAFASGATRVICLGADSPTLPPSMVQRAVRALDGADLVLGPCLDGGFYLLGLSRELPGLLEGIEWGGAKVSDQLRANATRLGAGLSELEEWYDIDRPADIARAVADLEQLETGPSPDALLAVLRRAQQAITLAGDPSGASR